MNSLKSHLKLKVQTSSEFESIFSDPESDVINFSGFQCSPSKEKSSDTVCLNALLDDVEPLEINFRGFEHSHTPQHLPSKEVDIFTDDINDTSFVGFQLSAPSSRLAAKKVTSNLKNGHSHKLVQISNVDKFASKDCSVLVQRMPKTTAKLFHERKKKKRNGTCNGYISRHCSLHSNIVCNENCEKNDNKNCRDHNFVDDTKILHSRIKSADSSNCNRKEKSPGVQLHSTNSLKQPTNKTSEAKSSKKPHCKFSNKTIILVNIINDMNSIYKICNVFEQFGVLSAVKLFDKSENQLYNLDNSVYCALIKFEKSEDALTAFTQFTHEKTSIHLVKENSNFTAESKLFTCVAC